MNVVFLSLFGLIVVVAVGFGAVKLISGLVGMFTGGSGVSMGHATLACPYCQQETRADRHVCEHCGRDL